MEEFHQITINEWLEVKEKLRRAVVKAANGFVELGYELRQIEEQELYRAGGYKSIAEFAESEPEFGLTPSMVSRLININKQFSDPEDPRRVRMEYNRMGLSKLTEMLNLPEQDREMIRPETKRDDIRELKRFNKDSEQAAGFSSAAGTDEKHEMILEFFRNNAEILNEVYSSNAYTSGDITKMSEIVNPSGSKTFRKGMMIMMMYEDQIKIKKMGGTPETLRWSEFFSIMQEIFEQAAAGSRTWDKYFNAGGEDEQIREPVGEHDGGADKPDSESSGEHSGRIPEDKPDSESSGEHSGRIPEERAGEGPEREKTSGEDEQGGKEGSKGAEVVAAERLEMDSDVVQPESAPEQGPEETGADDGINPPTSDVDNVDNAENCARAIEPESAEILNESASDSAIADSVDKENSVYELISEVRRKRERLEKLIKKLKKAAGEREWVKVQNAAEEIVEVSGELSILERRMQYDHG